MTTNNAQDAETRRQQRRSVSAAVITAVALVVACVALTAVSGGAATAAALQEENNTTVNNSDYYNGTMDVDNESWFAGIEDANLNSLGKLATRGGSYFIGTGSVDESGTGFQGVLLTGVVMAASMLGAVAGVGIGTVGGGVLAVVVGFGMTELGLAPAWFRVILLFGIGIIAFVALANILEAR